MIRIKNDTYAYGNAESDNDKTNARRRKKKNGKESNNTSYSAVSMNEITICLVYCLRTKETYLSCRALSTEEVNFPFFLLLRHKFQIKVTKVYYIILSKSNSRTGWKRRTRRTERTSGTKRYYCGINSCDRSTYDFQLNNFLDSKWNKRTIFKGNKHNTCLCFTAYSSRGDAVLSLIFPG